MAEPADVLVLAPHPDDAELAVGGTILRLVAAGRRVVVADMTRGEMGSRGSAEQRARECAAATAKLALTGRVNLDLPDAGLYDGPQELRAVVRAIRDHRPALLLAPMERDVHPDHAATGRVASRAFFQAGLARFAPNDGAPHRPRLLLRYPLHLELPAPTFCVDVTAVADAKLDVLRCYASQLPGPGARHHLVGLDPLERAQARDLFYGAQCGCRAAEPLAADRPVRVGDPDQLLAGLL